MDGVEHHTGARHGGAPTAAPRERSRRGGRSLRWPQRVRQRVREEVDRTSGLLRERVASARGQTLTELGHVGDRIQEILQQANRYVDELKGVLGDVTRGDAMERVARPHGRQAEAIKAYLAAFQEQSTISEQLTAEALEQCEEIRRARAGIGQVSQLSNILGLSAKVETVYLGEESGEFESLADEMKQLNLDVLEVSQSIDGLVAELQALLVQLQDQSGVMRDRTAAFGVRFRDHTSRVRMETERLQEAGVRAIATGDERVEEIRRLARSALEEMAFTSDLERELDTLEGTFSELREVVCARVGLDPAPPAPHPQPPAASWRPAPQARSAATPAEPPPAAAPEAPPDPPQAASPEEGGALAEGDLLMF